MSKYKSNTNIFNALSTLERRDIQRHIRTNWNNKSSQHPFLGVDLVSVGKNVRLTQEQYATLWLTSTLQSRRVSKPTGRVGKSRESKT